MTSVDSLELKLDQATDKALLKIFEKFSVEKVQSCFPQLDAAAVSAAYETIQKSILENFKSDYDKVKLEYNLKEKFEFLDQLSHDKENKPQLSAEEKLVDPKKVCTSLLNGEFQKQKQILVKEIQEKKEKVHQLEQKVKEYHQQMEQQKLLNSELQECLDLMNSF